MEVNRRFRRKFHLTVISLLAAGFIFLIVHMLIHSETKELTRDEIENLFLPMLRHFEKEGLQKAMAAFKNVDRFNVTYFLFAGSLLGSYRHHDIIPWDKDIDLLVKSEDRNVLKKYLESKKPEFELFTELGEVWRFSHKDAFLSKSGFRWPYMDIFFYDENATHVWATFHKDIDVKYDKTDLFPLIERPFMGMMVPAPRKTLAVLSQTFDVNKCKSNNYAFNDILVHAKTVMEIPCDLLKGRIPFVNRDHSFNETHTYETLEYIKFPTYLLPK